MGRKLKDPFPVLAPPVVLLPVPGQCDVGYPCTICETDCRVLCFSLTQLLWQQLIEENHVSTRQEIEDLGYGSTGELEPTENFYLTPKGITFYYNIYEIAPYVMGPTQITLPYESIQHLLNDTNGILKNLQ